jgi:predicted transcriptional regulator
MGFMTIQRKRERILCGFGSCRHASPMHTARMSFLAYLGVKFKPQCQRRGGQTMNHPITLPQTIIKRLEKLSSDSRRTPEAIIKQAITEKLDYEEWFAKQVAAGMADEKAGRVIGKEQFWEQLSKARSERKKAA